MAVEHTHYPCPFRPTSHTACGRKRELCTPISKAPTCGYCSKKAAQHRLAQKDEAKQRGTLPPLPEPAGEPAPLVLQPDPVPEIAPAGTDKRFSKLGTKWEAVLKVQHRQYALKRQADVEKLPTPFQQIGQRGGKKGEAGSPEDGGGGEGDGPAAKGSNLIRGMWAAKSSTDYLGILAVGRMPGRAVRIEAKSKRHDRVELGGKSGVQPQQAAALDRCLQMGGFAAVLVLLPAGMWLVPWARWKAPKDEPNRKSLNPAQLDAAGERIGTAADAANVINGRSARADWLAAAIRRRWV